MPKNLKVSDDIWKKVRKLADERGISAAEALNELIGNKVTGEQQQSDLPTNFFDRQAEIDRRAGKKAAPPERTYSLDVLRTKVHDKEPLRPDEIKAMEQLESIYSMEIERQIKLDKAYPGVKPSTTYRPSAAYQSREERMRLLEKKDSIEAKLELERLQREEEGLPP